MDTFTAHLKVYQDFVSIRHDVVMSLLAHKSLSLPETAYVYTHTIALCVQSTLHDVTMMLSEMYVYSTVRMRQAAWPETMLSRRFTHYLQPRALKVAPRGLRNLLGCLRNRTTRVSIPKAAISRASYGDLAPSSTLYRRTRLMTQYEKIKENYKDYILLFQVGDFYEIYGEDASELMCVCVCAQLVVCTKVVLF